jgi:type IV fimbrial biogenesis protein FimT
MRQKICSGFTIPELIITLGVAAIILTTAVPGVSNTIKNNRLAVRVNDIITDIHFARSESAKRDVRVILCRSKNPNASTPVCSIDSGTEYTWTWGYLIFADSGNAANSVYDAGSDILLRRSAMIAGKIMADRSSWRPAGYRRCTATISRPALHRRQSHRTVVNILFDKLRRRGIPVTMG